MPSPIDIVLAFSGGLDTSFCVPLLIERGYRVTTLFVDTGGIDAQERNTIEARALELGAHRHVTQDAGEELWESFVVPFVRAGRSYQDQYPLLCSDRYVITKRMTELANEIGTSCVAHGCTAAGNDQFRFDQAIRSLGSFEIIAPIRAIQSDTDSLREYEKAYLRMRGFEIEAKASRYTINQNCLGVTLSGAEIDDFKRPSDETHIITKPPVEWPRELFQATITFERGVPVAIDDQPLDGPVMLERLTADFGAYGVGRAIYTGDTTIGLKGRIVFESPALHVLQVAHRALEEAVCTKHQNTFKPFIARRWVELVYEGFFFDPLKTDLEAYLASSQEWVSGDVTVETAGGSCCAVAVDSLHVLERPDATYAQGASWTSEEAEGFIRLYGQSSTMAMARTNASTAHTEDEAVLCSI